MGREVGVGFRIGRKISITRDTRLALTTEAAGSLSNSEKLLGTLDATPKVPLYTDLTRGELTGEGKTKWTGLCSVGDL